MYSNLYKECKPALEEDLEKFLLILPKLVNQVN